jgi:hypothetical protein
MRTLIVGLFFALCGAFEARLNGKTPKAVVRQAIVGFVVGAAIWQFIRRFILP